MAGDTPRTEPRPARPIRDVLGRHGVVALMVWSTVARLPFGAVGLLLVLRTRELGGDYAAVGTVVGAFGLVSGLSEPVIARLIDRLGQSRMLAITVPANLAAFVLAAAVPRSWPIATLAVAGALIGFTYPQVGGMLRALLIEMFDDADERHAAFTLESGLAGELQIIVGPILFVTVIAGTSGAGAALAASGVVGAIGGALFARTTASRAWRPVVHVAGEARARLATRGFAVVVAVMATMGIGFGAFEVAVTAFAEHHGHRSQAGLLFALSAVGSLVGGGVSARLGAPPSETRRVSGLLAYQAATIALMALPHTIAVMCLLIVVNGVAVAPAIATTYGLAARTVPASRITEGYGWLGLGLMIGVSAGSVIAGPLVTRTSTVAAFLVPGVVIAAGWALTTVPLRRLGTSVPGGNATG